jgi:hypothetical protein
LIELGSDLTVALLLALAAFIMVWALVKLRDSEPSTLVTIVLGLLTLVAIGGFLLVESDILGTIAATGVGALAGAVSNIFDSSAGRRERLMMRQQSEQERQSPPTPDGGEGPVG